MSDQKPLNPKESSDETGIPSGVVPMRTAQTSDADLITFSQSDAFVPEPPAGEEEPVADAVHEQTFDVDSELQSTSLAEVPISIVQPTVAPVQREPVPVPQPLAAATTIVPPVAPQAPVTPVAPFVPPGFVPAKGGVQKSVPAAVAPTAPGQAPLGSAWSAAAQATPPPPAPKMSSIREPRSFASLTPLVMRDPVDVQSTAPQMQQPPLRAPIPISQDVPNTPAPGTVTKQPDARAEPTQSRKAEEPRRPTVLEQLREQTTSVLRPLRTYQTDAQGSIKESNASLISVAAAEETRRARTQYVVKPAFKPVEAPRHNYLRTVLFILGTTVLLAGGAGIVSYVLSPKTVNIPQQGMQTLQPIFVDESVELPAGGLTHVQLMQFLTDMREKTGLALGLIREIYFTFPTTDGSERLATISELLPRIAPHAPAELLRTLDEAFLVGVHVYDGNQGFILLKTNAYEQAFSAMLMWEPTMREDLLPFLDRRPGLKLNADNTPAPTPAKVINSAFVDVVLKNHDTRALYNDVGDVIFLYSFIDRNTILITTNDRTLGEVISRIANP